MKKTVAILLLLLVVGCGKNEQTSELSPQQPPAPTLADSLEGKRIHFQLAGDNENENPPFKNFWLQLGKDNQLTVHDVVAYLADYVTLPYVITDTKLIVEEEAVTIKFNKAEPATGDKVTVIEHNRSSSYIILKIEAAQNWRPHAAKIELQALGKALVLYQIDTDSYPDQKVGLNALEERPEGSLDWGGPYLKRAVPRDPWGNEYFYELGLKTFDQQIKWGLTNFDQQDTFDEQVFKIWSAGSNKKNENGANGTDDIVEFSFGSH